MLGTGVGLLYFSGFTGTFFILTQYLQIGLHYSALGAGLAARFFELGLRVGMCGRKRPEPPAGVDRQRVATMSADVREASDLEALTASVAQRFGRVDLWVNNAGVIDPIGKLAP